MKDMILFATGNEKKMLEIRAILADLNRRILSMKEAGIDVEIIEDGDSFEENALIKAREIYKRTGALVLADDSGLEVDYLDKEPGIHSARYLGEDTPYSVKNQAIIDRLEGVEGAARSARFRCVIAAVFPDGTEAVEEGTIEGVIACAPSGNSGFGYDPIFYLPEQGKTTADLTPKEKNAISHRGQALEKMKQVIRKYYERIES